MSSHTSDAANTNFEGFDPAPLLATAEKTTARKMLHIYRAFNALAQRQYAQRGYHDLSPVHVSLMAYLERGGTRIVDLAAKMGTTKQFAGRLVKELAEMGFVTLSPDPSDRRATLVQGTPPGWRFLVEACDVLAAIESQFKALLGEARYAAFVEALDLLVTLDTPAAPPVDRLVES
jgi:DNA-binding MarR family transcriptional regulator